MQKEARIDHCLLCIAAETFVNAGDDLNPANSVSKCSRGFGVPSGLQAKDGDDPLEIVADAVAELAQQSSEALFSSDRARKRLLGLGISLM